MRIILSLLVMTLVSASSVMAGFTERKLENTKRSAEKSGKLIAFIFYEDFTTYREERDITAATARNSAVKKAVPRADVTIIEINRGDKDTNKLPACVAKEGKYPRVVITDAACEKVIVQYDGAPNREKVKEIENKVAAAIAALPEK